MQTLRYGVVRNTSILGQQVLQYQYSHAGAIVTTPMHEGVLCSGHQGNPAKWHKPMMIKGIHMVSPHQTAAEVSPKRSQPV